VVLRKVKYELNSKQEQAFKNKFVQAPVTSYEDVSTFVKTFSSTGRVDRISKRQKISEENSVENSIPKRQKISLNNIMHPPFHDDNDDDDDDDEDNVIVTATVDVASPGVLPPLEVFNKYFQKKYQELGCDIEAFRSYPNVRRELKAVQYTYGRDCVVELAPSVYLVHCRGASSTEDECELFVTRSKMPGNERRPACDSCNLVLKAQHKKLSRKQSSIERGQDQSDPSSKANIGVLTPTTTKVKLRNVVKKLKETKKKLKRLELKLHCKLDFSVDDETRNALTQAFEHCKATEGKGGGKSFQAKVVTALLEMETCDGIDGDPDKRTTADEFASRVVEEIAKYALVLTDKKQQVRFSPRIMRIAMAAWLDCPSGYDRLKENSLEIFPHARTLYRLQHKMTYVEGISPKVYGWLRDDLDLQKRPSANLYGHVVFDEMKLQSDIYWHSRSGKMMGFASSNANKQLSLMKEVEALYQEEGIDSSGNVDFSGKTASDDAEPMYEPAKYVNLFRYRSVHNYAHNCEFFLQQRIADRGRDARATHACNYHAFNHWRSQLGCGFGCWRQ